ncbi:unnamed protein product [Ectocarpus sp. 13 AM-2016]
MHLVNLFLAALAAPLGAQGFVVQHRTPLVASSRRVGSMTPTMCVPKEVAAAILVAGAGYILTQGVPPAKAADMVRMNGSPTVCITREVDGAPQLDGLGFVRALEAKSVLSHESFPRCVPRVSVAERSTCACRRSFWPELEE